MKKNEFIMPRPEFRGMVFWALNGKLDPMEMKRQIRVFKEMGFNGFFLHSRVGLKTEYLGREWFDCVNACAEEAGRLGMKAWLYDEDRWPSGFAGGMVSRVDEFRAKKLCLEEGEAQPGENILAYYNLRFKDGVLVGYGQCEPDSVQAKDEKFFRAYWKYEDKDDAFNGESYVDTMHPGAINHFLKCTHQKYLDNSGRHFGRSIPGIFTDEPNYALVTAKAVLPWTHEGLARFRDFAGYDLLPTLPELFFQTPSPFSKTRMDFHAFLSQQFDDAFFKQISQWCAMNNLVFTGHLLYEDTPTKQAAHIGAAMRHYEHFNMPGIDLITDKWASYLAAKQLSSVAHQMGIAQRLTETDGCTGWDYPLYGYKCQGDWQYALGINRRCLHLAMYTMEGIGKRDYPPSVSYQTSWHRQYRFVEDYFARIAQVLDNLTERRTILMLHPMESVWGERYAKMNEDALNGLDHDFMAISHALLANNLDFDYGDEEILTRLKARVEDGRIVLGKAEYSAVLVPPISTIRRSTLDLLLGFAAAGGDVYVLGKAPVFMDGIASGKPEDAWLHFKCLGSEKCIAELGERHRLVSIADEEGRELEPLLHLFAEGEEYDALFICNTGMKMPECVYNVPGVRNRRMTFPHARVCVKLEYKPFVAELELESGRLLAKEAICHDDGCTLDASFDMLQSHLYLFSRKPIEVEEKRVAPDASPCPVEMPEDGWHVRLDAPNCLPLDHVTCRLDGKVIAENAFINAVDAQIRAQLGLPKEHPTMIQPWARKDCSDAFADFELDMVFQCDFIPPEGIHFALENPKYFHASLNGMPLKLEDDGWWMDTALKTVPIPARLLRKGTNSLTIGGRYCAQSPTLEGMFLTGDFGVNGMEHITSPVRSLKPGDWCRQGLPYYAGNVTYIMHCSTAITGKSLEIADWQGTALEIKCNGNAPHILAWPPFVCDLSEDSGNVIELTVCGHCRNALGPFYLNTHDLDWVGFDRFSKYEHEGKDLVPVGLLSAPTIR